jgi:hypothetical protein
VERACEAERLGPSSRPANLQRKCRGTLLATAMIASREQQQRRVEQSAEIDVELATAKNWAEGGSR